MYYYKPKIKLTHEDILLLINLMDDLSDNDDLDDSERVVLTKLRTIRELQLQANERRIQNASNNTHPSVQTS